MSEGASSIDQADVSPGMNPPASARSKKVALSLLGGVSLQYAGRELFVQNRKAKALLGYLALTPNLRDTRDRIVGLLWSETEEFNARASLRQVLHALRETFDAAGFTGFSTGRSEIAFEEDALQLDVRSILASAGSGRPHRVLIETPHISETLLVGYDDLDSSFRSWLVVQRENLRQKLIRSLERRLEEPSDTRAAQQVAEALFQLDQTHEAACRRLIRCRVELGDTAGALAAYKKLWDLLASEYDTEPAEETQVLIASIKAGSYQPATPLPVPRMGVGTRPAAAADSGASVPFGAARAVASRLVLAVGRFDMDAIDKEQQQVGIGFRFDLISRLVRFREWSLVDTENLPIPLQSVAPAQQLYLISAKFLPGRGAANFILTLQAADTGVVAWSERFGLGAGDFFGTQQAILHRIAAVLNVNLSVERLNRLAAAPDVSLDIYDRWLRGQRLLLLFDQQARARATAIFESIVAEGSNFAPAYSSLAQIENSNHFVFVGASRTSSTVQKALSMAKIAVSLDPLDSRAQLSLGWAHAMSEGFDLAEAHFRQACELNENDPWTTTSAALGFAFSDYPAEARSVADRALDRVPFPVPIHWVYQSQIRFVCGDYSGSLEAAQQAGDAITYFLGWRAATLAHLGRVQDARAEGRRFLGAIAKHWAGAVPPTADAVAKWFLSCFPIRNKGAWEQLRSGLEAAGLPTPP